MRERQNNFFEIIFDIDLLLWYSIHMIKEVPFRYLMYYSKQFNCIAVNTSKNVKIILPTVHNWQRADCEYTRDRRQDFFFHKIIRKETKTMLKTMKTKPNTDLTYLNTQLGFGCERPFTGYDYAVIAEEGIWVNVSMQEDLLECKQIQNYINHND